jgi:long-chain acyl-CoA synthetase
MARRAFKTAVIDDQRQWKNIEILVAAMHLAGEIERRSQSRTIATLLPTSGMFPAAALAGWMLGRVVVPLNYLLSHDEIDWITRHCETDAVVTVGPILDHLKYEPKVLTIRLEEVSFKGMPEPRFPASARADDLAALLYTSGTSGRPKGVELTHGNLRENVRQIDEWVDFGSDDRMLGALPQFHSFGFTVLTLLPMTIGIPVVYTARFVPTQIVRLMREHRPTFFVALPSMYNALATVKSATAEDFASLRYIVSGGEPLPESVFKLYQERFNKTINEGYGLTETAPVTNWCRPHEFRRRSVGRALPRVTIDIVDLETERELPAGRPGEVRIGGPNVSRGYFKNAEASRAMHDEKGRLRTGDIGRLDADGHLYITGRHKEMLIIAGENVFPREIEEVLNQHPSVRASGVVGEMDDLRGEVAVAAVEMVDDLPFDEDELRRWVRERIGPARTPRKIACLDELPKGPTGKVQRRELKRMLDAGELFSGERANAGA